MQTKFDHVLIIDDNKEILIALKILLRKFFNNITTLESPANLHSVLSQNTFDVIILDMNFRAGDNSGNEGLFWIKEILKLIPDASIICITAYGAVNLAVRVMQEGALDFIEKPWDEEKFIASILRLAKLKETSSALKKLKSKNSTLTKKINSSFDFVKGNSDVMKAIWQSIEKIAPTDANVLITGKNGTGKEVLAKNIHNKSTRSQKPFIAVDLGSLSENLFESELFGHTKGAFTNAKEDKTGWLETANGGTIFLDEIGNLSLEQQAKLLTVIQNKKVVPVGSVNEIQIDIRIICATNANLKEMVQKNTFREDLMYRLNTITIELPGLKERSEDIPIFLDYYLEKFKSKYKKPLLEIPQKLYKRLAGYSWPGNIRELKHSVERAVILSETNKLDLSDFHLDDLNSTVSFENSEDDLNLAKHEEKMIKIAINKAKGNYSKAAELLGISRRTLYNKIEKYEL